MGGRGNFGSRNFTIPNKPRFEKWTGGWMLVDKDKDRFENGWDSGINISKV